MSMRERLVPVAAAVAVVAVGLTMIMLLRSANNNGISALEAAKQAQIATTARSFNTRVEASLSSVGALGARPWDLTRGSSADQSVLESYAVDPKARSGSFLVDAGGTITAGVLLQPGELGARYDPPGWAAAKAKLATQAAVVLPVTGDGVTTDLPSYAFAVAIPGATPGTLRGVLVFEAALTTDSAFSQEIGALAAGDQSSGVWRFVDSNGVVVATSAATGLGEPVRGLDVSRLRVGQSQEGGDLVFTADAPVVGWRVVFTQPRSEFVAPVAGPLRTAGLVLVLLMLAIGLVLVTVLIRRLRQAREEERRLRQLSRSQEEFVSVVSHELRTPVAGVLGFLQTTLDHWDAMSEDDRRTAVQRAFVNARRLQTMSRDVLDTESIEAGRLGYTMTDVDLAAEVIAAVEAFTSDSDLVELDQRVDHVEVRADPDRLQQVLANLLDNARKNAPPETQVRLTLDRVGDRARIVVEDQGGGIDPAQAERIFEKFVRGRDGGVTGTGLGLYISHQIVTAHHGRIWVDTDSGDTTRFVVELPCAASDPGSGTRPSALNGRSRDDAVSHVPA